MNSADELRYLILAVQREGNRLFAERLRVIGITPSQAEVINVLHEAQPLSLIEVGQRLVCETGSPSRLVDGLVKAGLVKRFVSEKDQRKVVLTLTESGEETYRRVVEAEQMFGAVFATWGSEHDIDTFKTALWSFVQDKPAGQALARRLQSKKDE